MGPGPESIGFVARWCLLALAAGLVIITAVVAVSAGMSASGGDEPETMLFSDLLWMRSEPVYILTWAVVSPPIGPERNELVIVFPVGGEPRVSQMNDQGVLIQIGEVSDGPHAVGVVGLPHSRRTFAASQLILAAPRDRRVTLISAKECLSLWKTESGETQVRQVIDELHRSSAIVWICGDAEAFAQERQWARQIDPESILVYRGSQWPIEWDSLRVFHRQSGLRDAEAALLTWDRSLAIMAAKLGMESHLISPDQPLEPLPAGVWHHATLGKFKESLREAPISD